MDQEQVKQLAKRSQKESLENKFLVYWTILYPQLPPPTRQHPILNPDTGRFWKIDFAWVPDLLAVEIQGGSWLLKGGHNTALGQAKDYARQNHLIANGWRLLCYNTPMLKDMAAVVTNVAEVLCHSKELP